MRFILSDESTNTYGYRVRTAGIDLGRFLKNPVMLYGHDAERVIGHWRDVRLEKTRLTAEPVFDQDELSQSVKRKVDAGTLNACSVGLLPGKLNGDETLMLTCELMEASIVPIPSNGNAVRILKHKAIPDLIHLTFSTPKPDMELTKRLAALLGLPEDTNDEQVEQAIADMVAQRRREAEELVSHAVRTGRITLAQKPHFLSFAKSDLTGCKAILEAMQSNVRLTDVLKLAREERAAEQQAPGMGGKPKSQWTLTDYRKLAPQELRANPELYQRLVAEATGQK